MNRAIAINLTHTRMIIIKLIVSRSEQLMHHGELHLTAKIKIINR
jgi:hypothetical protein